MPSDTIDRDAILRAVRDTEFARYVLDARKRLLDGRATTLREIRAIYREAGRLLAEDMRRLPRGTASWEIRERLREAIRARSRELSSRVAQAVTRGIHLGARVGVDPFARITASLTSGIVDSLRIEQAFLALAERQAAAQIARVGRDGLRLSDRIWRLDDITRRELERLIQAGILAGWDPRRLAQAVERYLQPVVARPHRLELQRRLGVGRDVSYQAMRLARTELAIAQHEAAIAAAAATPGVELMDWLLSKAHAIRDRCDVLAASGPYPIDRVPPRPHPQCLAPGTRVLTGRGWLAVEDVRPGDLVLTHLGRWRPVLAAWSEEADDLLEFELPDGSRLRVTGNHPLLTPDGWVRADELRGRPARYLRPEWDEEALRGAALPEGAWEWGWLRLARRTGRPVNRPWQVYNLSVAEDESFVAEGVVVHNCMCYVVPRLPDRQEAVNRLINWVRNPASDPVLERWWQNLSPMLGAGPRPVIRISTPGGTAATLPPGPGARLADVARNLSPEETWRSLTLEVDSLMRDAAAAEGVQYAVQGWTADGPTRGPVMDGAFGFTHLRPGGAPVTIAGEVVEAVTRLLRDPELSAAKQAVALRGLRTLLHEASHQLRRYGNVTTADLAVLGRWGAGFVAEEGSTDLLAVLRLPDFAARLGVGLPSRPWAYASPAYRSFARFVAGLAGLAGRSRAAAIVTWVHDWRTDAPLGWYEAVARGILAAQGVEGEEGLARELAARVERAAERIRAASAVSAGHADGLVAEEIRGLRQWVRARVNRGARRRVGTR